MYPLLPSPSTLSPPMRLTLRCWHWVFSCSSSFHAHDAYGTAHGTMTLPRVERYPQYYLDGNGVLKQTLVIPPKRADAGSMIMLCCCATSHFIIIMEFSQWHLHQQQQLAIRQCAAMISLENQTIHPSSSQGFSKDPSLFAVFPLCHSDSGNCSGFVARAAAMPHCASNAKQIPLKPRCSKAHIFPQL